MRRPKVDLTGCTVVGLEATPKVADRTTGELATDADGRTKWSVSVFVSDPATKDSGAVKVTVPSSTPIALSAGDPLVLVNPRVLHWEVGNRSGMAWSADAVESAGGGKRGE
ncbi:hypothetical protein BSP109_03239 [Brevibacterium sp. Mu109]|nr:hypothetical protein BSP109_03239 [Brevibacterium sp. Mu109]